MGDSAADGENPMWIKVQVKTFTRWMNTYLVDRNMEVKDITQDLSDGLILVNLVEIISNYKFPRYNKKPRFINMKLENINFVLNYLRGQGLKFVGIGAEDLQRGNLKLVLGFIWTLILRYQIEKGRQESAKNALLEWVRSKIPQCDVKNFTTSWSDGIAICSLVNALLPDTIPMDGRDPADAVKNATDGVNAAEEHMGIPAVLHPEDMVEAADDLSCMTYISYFRDWKAKDDEAQRLRELELERQRREMTPVASQCSVSGNDMKTAEVNIPEEFDVKTRNADGKDLKQGGADVRAQVKDPDGEELKAEDLTCKDNGDGTYHLGYTPRKVGKHDVAVLVNGEPINEKPFVVDVLPATPDPTQCTVSGPGVEGGIEAGKPAPFTIQARNRIGDPISVGGHSFAAKVTDPYGGDIACELKDNNDGTYAGEYVPVPGVNTVELSVEARPLKDSPYKVEAAADPDRAFAANSYAFGPGLEEGKVNTWDPATFTIQAVNPAGEKLAHGGDEFTVEVEDSEGNELEEDPEVKDNGDGTYGVTYKVPRPGKYTVSVDLHKPEARALSDPIKDSPFTVSVAAGFDPEKSEVYGPGVDKTVEDVEPADFHVRSVDQDGNPLKEGGLPIEVSVTDPDGEEVPAELKDNGDGTYDVSYKPEKRGPHKVAVNCRGVPVGKSPFDVDVVAGADPDNCGIGTFKLSVTAKNRRGEPLDHGGDNMEVILKKKSGDEPWEGKADVIDNGDGTYSAGYEVPGSGDYEVTVRLNGRKIKGCPFKQVIP